MGKKATLKRSAEKKDGGPPAKKIAVDADDPIENGE